MFTWNIQYISKNKLTEILSHMRPDAQKGEILVRIHTAIHTPQEAVEIAAHIRRLIPSAHIFGTSTSAVIYRGKLLQNQCVVSITRMSETGTIRSARFETFEDGMPLPDQTLCTRVRERVIGQDSRLLLTFLTGKYMDVYGFVEQCNDTFPGVHMIGGLANTPDISLRKFADSGFVFDDTGWSHTGIILASIGGEDVECLTSCATGAESMGEDLVITETFGSCVLALDGKDAAKQFRIGTGDLLKEQPETANLFPYVYSDASHIPIVVRYTADGTLRTAFPEDNPANAVVYERNPSADVDVHREMIIANHNVPPNKKLRRAFIYDQKVIADNRDLFSRIESFEKQETIFSYSCLARSMIYSNCVKWELTPYEDTNLCGCITEGEIARIDGKNVFANCTFVVSVLGEAPAAQKFNPYAFTSTQDLATDNNELLKYLVAIERAYSDDGTHKKMAASLKAFIQDCELKLLYAEDGKMPNASAMQMDMQLRGFDRICMIHVPETVMMEKVFGSKRVMLTRQQFCAKCERLARDHGYKVYETGRWTLAIGTASYLESLSGFSDNMKRLRTMLMETMEDAIQIMPTVCVLDGCSPDTVMEVYSAALREMNRRNVQMIEYHPQTSEREEERFREKYRVINLLSYAARNDGVIPYFQGIMDNKQGRISHYESLMRIVDEEGKLHFPNEFLDIAREFGTLYDAISAAMIQKVFERFSDKEDVMVSLNIGVRDIDNTDLMNRIYGFLATAAHPENFIFELLENEDINSYERVELFIRRIHSLGAKVSLDDFGSGFSNLQHVVNLNLDYVKIDGSIVRKCDTDPNCQAILALIANWKKSRADRISLVAEFVENESIQNVLLAYGIDYSQGYLFSKPAAELMG